MNMATYAAATAIFALNINPSKVKSGLSELVSTPRAMAGATSETVAPADRVAAAAVFLNSLSFSEFPVGTSISGQYAFKGVIFDAPAFIATDRSNPTSPVLSGTPEFRGPIAAHFVDPVTGSPATVLNFQLDAGYFDAANSTQLSWFDRTGALIGSQRNARRGIETFTVAAQIPVASFRIETVGSEAAGFAVDNLGFDRPTQNADILAAISAQEPFIPDASRVVAGKVLTRTPLLIAVTKNGALLPGKTIALQSDRGALDTIDQPNTPTNALGVTTARAETRDQPGPSTIRSATQDVATNPQAVVTWLPARFENKFLVTCYRLAVEANFPSSPRVGPVRGLPPEKRYRSAFLTDIITQGSGIAEDGTYIHYDRGGRYSIQSCALMSTGRCAEDGVSLAVDPSVIPKKSTVSIDTEGERQALDVGDQIKDHHVDVYYGQRSEACINAGRRSLDVHFIRY